MLCVVGDIDRLVDEQHGDAVLDPVHPPKTWVVEALVVNEEQRPAILRADEDAQELFVEHDRGSADRLGDRVARATDGDAATRGSGVLRHTGRRLADAEVESGLLLS